MKVYIGGSDTFEGTPLYKVIVNYCKEEGIAGSAVHRCIYGYGRDSVIHSSRTLSLSDDLPIVIEMIDSEENLRKVLPKIREITKGSLITMQDVEVIEYDCEVE
jgi:PII-like signaling protein